MLTPSRTAVLFSCAQVVARFRIHLRQRGYSDGTVRQRIGDIERMTRALGPLSAVTQDALLAYLSPDRNGWRPEYRKRITASIRIFYTWANHAGLINGNPALELPTVRIPRAIPRPVPEAVVLSAFQQGTLAERAMLALGAALGLRREEIATAHPRNRSGETLRVIGKNSDERVVALDTLTAALLYELEVEQGQDVYYFPGRFGGHLHPATIYKWVKARLGPEWSTHNLRHRAATIGLDCTGDIRAVQELLGHRSISSTQLYTAVTGSRIARVVEATSLGSYNSSRRIAGQAVEAPLSDDLLADPRLQTAIRLLASLNLQNR